MLINMEKEKKKKKKKKRRLLVEQLVCTLKEVRFKKGRWEVKKREDKERVDRDPMKWISLSNEPSHLLLRYPDPGSAPLSHGGLN